MYHTYVYLKVKHVTGLHLTHTYHDGRGSVSFNNVLHKTKMQIHFCFSAACLFFQSPKLDLGC